MLISGDAIIYHIINEIRRIGKGIIAIAENNNSPLNPSLQGRG